MGAFTSEQTLATDSETNPDDLSEGSDNASQSEHGSNQPTTNKYKFRETDIRLKQIIKNKLKKDELSTSLHSTLFNRSKQNKENNKRLSLNLRKNDPVQTTTVSNPKLKRNRSKSTNKIQNNNKKNKVPEAATNPASKFDIFEFTDDENIDLSKLNSSRISSKKKLKRTKSNPAVLLNAKKRSSTQLTVKVPRDRHQKNKLVLNRTLSNLNDIGSNCEGSTSSCLSNLSVSNTNSNESFIFNDNFHAV